MAWTCVGVRCSFRERRRARAVLLVGLVWRVCAVKDVQEGIVALPVYAPCWEMFRMERVSKTLDIWIGVVGGGFSALMRVLERYARRMSPSLMKMSLPLEEDRGDDDCCVLSSWRAFSRIF